MKSIILSLDQIRAYRRIAYRLDPTKRLRTKEQAIEFVNERGFIHFWPIQDVVLPSLWNAVAGDRPVPNEHDDPGYVSWTWKDELLDKKVWYYARVLRKRNTIISLGSLPFFYALSPNYGEPEIDYLEQYEAGTMTQETKLIFEALLKEGPLDTLSLRKAARLSNPESTSRFNRALDTLQAEFKALPIGIAEAGAWKYSFIYELTHRYFPELQETARPISEGTARRHLLRQYLLSVGAATPRDIQRVFSWRPEDIQRAVASLVKEEYALDQLNISGMPGSYISLAELITTDH
jgi:hypothetical protein